MVRTNQGHGSAMLSWRSPAPSQQSFCSETCPVAQCRITQQTCLQHDTQRWCVPHCAATSCVCTYVCLWASGHIHWRGEWSIGQFWGAWSCQHWNKLTVEYWVHLPYSGFSVSLSRDELFCTIEKPTGYLRDFGPMIHKQHKRESQPQSSLCKQHRNSGGGVERWARARGQGKAMVPGSGTKSRPNCSTRIMRSMSTVASAPPGAEIHG